MLAHWNQALYMYGQPAAAEQGLGPQVLFRLPPSGEGSPSVTINSAAELEIMHGTWGERVGCTSKDPSFAWR